MSEGWKQVWQDFRQALREPEEPEAVQQSTGETTPATSGSPSVAMQDGAEAEQQPAEPHPNPSEADEADVAVEPATADEEQNVAAVEPLPARWGLNRTASVLLFAGVGAGLAFLLWWGRSSDASPPAPNVVVTFDGGQITVEDMQQHLALLAPDAETQARFRDVQDYRALVQEMIMDELVRRWAAERKADRDENIQHVMEHITEEINLDALHTQMHQEQIDVDESEIRAYYEENQDLFGDQTLTQVREQIRITLQAEREDQFVQEYIDRLRQNAAITRDFALLEVPEPSEAELKAYYEGNKRQFVIPGQAVVDEIRIPLDQDEAAAEEQANQALVRLRSGEAFGTVAAELSAAPVSAQSVTVRNGQREPAYDEVVFGLDEGEISDVFRAGDVFYVVRLRSQEPERQQSLDEVRELVRQAVLAEKEAAWFEEKANRTLFTIHGQRFTVGEFWQEYQELPPTFLLDYQGNEGRKALAERLIERLLLVEDSYDRLLDVQNQAEIEEIRLDVLAQMMDQEEVDDKIEITDEEVRAYYDAHKADLVEPPQARIRAILVRLGQSEDERQRAWDKANEAYRKLVPGLFQTGADFAEIARQYSEDAISAGQGGEMAGWVQEGPDLLTELVEHPFHQQVFALREGEISRPFEWNGAIYIVQVLERREPRPLTFEEAEAMLREELRLQEHDALADRLFQDLMERANVTVYDRTLQAFVEQQGLAQSP